MLVLVLSAWDLYQLVKDDGFSYDACKELVNYYSEFGEYVEFDRVSIRSDWNEYDYGEWFEENKEYLSIPDDLDLNDFDELKQFVLKCLEEVTFTIDLGDSVLFMSY